MFEEYGAIVIEAGPSGLSVGIFVAPQQILCFIKTKDLGDQLDLIPKLENYPRTRMSSGPLLTKTLQRSIFDTQR